MLAMCAVIWAFAPEPTAIMVMTALIPTMIPNMVNAERILLTLRALNAIGRSAKKVVTIPVCLYRMIAEIVGPEESEEKDYVPFVKE